MSGFLIFCGKKYTYFYKKYKIFIEKKRSFIGRCRNTKYNTRDKVT